MGGVVQVSSVPPYAPDKTVWKPEPAPLESRPTCPVAEPVTVAAAVQDATRNAPRAIRKAAKRVLPALRRGDIAALAAAQAQADLQLVLAEFRAISELAEAAIWLWLEEEDEETTVELLLLAA